MGNVKTIGVLAGIAILVVGGIAVGLSATKDIGKSSYEISEEDAVKKMERVLKGVSVSNATPRKAAVNFTEDSLAESLPDISEYKMSVTGTGAVDVEIFVSPEKSGSGTDGWMNYAAEAFNQSGYHTKNGATASVSIRSLSSGVGADYIVSGKYLPDAYAPSNTLWGTMAIADGAALSTTHGAERLVGNVAGILLSEEIRVTLKENYGGVSLESVTQATTDGVIAMGYTYPYSSSTGMNFLISTLHQFDAENPLSNQAVSQFQKFQENVPFVCYTTLQMRNAMESGSLNACIMEYQTYLNDSELQKKYEFVPFGVRHDNPVYEVGNIGAEKEEVLSAFCTFCLQDDMQKEARKYGFNQLDDYVSDQPSYDAVTLLNAQKLWKEEKDTGKPVVAVFVADVSGSMAGEPLNHLKTSLTRASQYINSNNYIGLISYSNHVTVNLPIAQFDLNQRAYFTGAVEDLSAFGSTATYDAVIQGISMLRTAKEEIPDAKLMLFVLSDGETNVGCGLSDIRSVIATFGIPIYTIGYNADLEELGVLSAINEAATIDADTEDVIYKLGALFNAQM